MAMTPSQLSIIVKSQGIEKATQDLDKLSKAAASVDAETKAFVIAQSKLSESNQKVSKSSEATARGISVQELAILKAHEAALKMNASIDRQVAAQERLSNAVQMTSRGISKQELDMVKAQEQAIKMNKALDEKAERLAHVNSRGSIWNNTLKSMTVAASAYIGVNFVKGIVEQADAWTMLEAKLKLATGSSHNAKVVQQDLFDMAQKLRIPLEDAGKLYTRLADPMRKAGKDSKETMQVVSGLSLALKLGGATAQEASSAMLQFSQAMNSGRLNGGEFNSMAENAPLILKAIEAQLRRTGKWTDMTTESLKKMGSEGKIGVTLIAEAVSGMGVEWQKQFDTLPLTVDGAITRVKNAWFKAMGEMGEETGMGKALAGAIKIVEDMIPTIRDKMIQGFINVMMWIDKNKEGLKEMGSQLSGLIGQVVDLAGSTASVAQGFNVIGFGIYSLRLGLAGLMDGIKLIQAAFAGLGSAVMVTLTSPLKLVFEVAEKLAKYIAESFGTLASAAKAVGFDDISKGLRMASGEAGKLGENAKAMGTSLKDFTMAGFDMAGNIVEDFKNGNTEVQKLLNGTDEVSKAVEQRGKYEESADLARNKRLTKAKELALANEKAIKSAQKDFEKAEQEKADAVEKSTTAIQTQIDKLAYLQKAGNDGKYTSSQKDAVALEVQLEKYENRKLSRADALRKYTLEYLIVQNKVLQAREAEVKVLEDSQAMEAKASEDYDKKLTNAQEELVKNEALLNSDEKRIEVMAQLAAATQYDIYLSAIKNGATVQEIDRQLELYEILKKNAGVVGAKVDKDNSLKQTEDAKKRLDDLFNTSKVDKFETASTKALKGIVKGFAELNKALTTYGTKQEKISQARRDNLETNYGDFKKFSEQEAAIANKEVDYKLASYADMADAAKNFFDEGTKGYQAMDAVSKIYHAAQMARNLTEMAMMATKGIMNQAAGDVYTAIPRMAAMAAIMAGLGFATGAFGSSGGGGAKAADVQKTQGSGSVFGDTEAKSESIKKSLDLLKSSYDKLYPVNQGMLKALKNIESSMTGLSNLVLRSGGVIEGTNLGIATGQLNAKGSPTDMFSSIGTQMTKALFGSTLGGSIAKFINNLWGKTTQSIVDSGIQFGGSLASMQKGQGFNQYASVDTTTSSWFGLKKDTRNSVQTQGLNDELSTQFGLVFTNMQKSLEEAGKVLYGSSKGVTDALDSLVLSTSKISLKGLSGQALTEAINAVISKGLDEMAAAAFKSFDKFRQVGEGYAQTVIRVANNFATVNAVFDKLGMKMYETSDAGIEASMAFTGLFDSLENMQSVASEYYDKFYTEAEKQNKITDALKKQFAEMNLVLPDSAKAYRELVDNTSDPEKIAMLWKLSGAFSEVFGTIEQGVKEIPQAMKYVFDSLSKDAERWLSIRNQAASLKDEISMAMGNPQKDPAIRMQQLWDAMSKDVTPEQKLQLAGELKDLMLQKYQVEKDNLTRLIDFGKQLRGYVDSLKVGSLSPLTVGQKLAEAQTQYQATFAKAQGGDVAAQGMLQGKADTYLQLAQTALASSSEYSAIFSEVTNGLDSLGIESMSAAEQANQTATEQLAELQRLSDFVGSVEVTANNYYNSSLTALASQITLMDAMYQKMGIFDGMLSSIAGLPAEIAAALSGKVGSSFGNDEFIRNLYQTVEGRVGSQIDAAGYNYWMKDLMTQSKEQVASNFVTASQENNVNRTSNTTSSLEAQVAALTAEVKGLREDANLQTGAIITAQVMSTETSTTAIVTATKESVVNESWQNSLKPELA